MIPEMFGSKVRCRPVEDVIRDIQIIIHKVKQQKVLFVDDNLIANRRHAKELFTELIHLHIEWCAECTLNIAEEATRADVATFVPKTMTPAELEEMFLRVCRRFYSLPSLVRRLLLPPTYLRFDVLVLNLLANLQLIQWPRLRRTPFLTKVLRPLARRFRG